MKYYIIIVLLLLTACVKPFYPDTNKYDKTLVIDGLLSDDGRPPVVRVSATKSNSTIYLPKINDAIVYINSSDGKRYDLEETASGEYSYLGQMFPVAAGMSFELVVEFEGNVYTSLAERMLPAVPISGVSAVVVPGGNTPGVDICVSSTGTEDDSRYYAWAYIETWRFKTEIGSLLYLDKVICYANVNSRGIIIGLTENNTVNKLDSKKIYTVPNYGSKLYMRYSTLIIQYSISRDTYMYLQHVQTTNENNGSLFDPIPSDRQGNITCASAPVIGNFQVSAHSTKRLFIDRSILPEGFLIPQESYCHIKEVPSSDTELQGVLVEEYLGEQGMAFMDTTRRGSILY